MGQGGGGGGSRGGGAEEDREGAEEGRRQTGRQREAGGGEEEGGEEEGGEEDDGEEYDGEEDDREEEDREEEDREEDDGEEDDGEEDDGEEDDREEDDREEEDREEEGREEHDREEEDREEEEALMRLLDTAQALADERPEAMWPCPLCAAEVKGQNLSKHVEKHHGGVDEVVAWDGRDRASAIPATLLFIGLLGAAVVGSALKLSYARPAGMVLTALSMVALGVAVAAAIGAMPARLRLDDDALELTYGFGLLSKKIALDAQASVEVGTLKQRRSSAIRSQDMNAPTTDHKVGSYLRLVSEGRAITLGSKKSIGMQHRFTGERLSRGDVRRHWDALVLPTALIAISLVLVERGALAARA